jgi:antitoxin component YwqK of YwqJK toxin-antitoxin module
VAKKMMDAYCNEKKNELKNLQEVNDAIKHVNDLQIKYSAYSNNLNILTNLRDNYIADEIKKCKSKSDYFSFLINQYNIENNRNEGSIYNATSIANRVISNKSNMNGTYDFWQSNGSKETYTFSNGIKNGAYIKTSEDEKISLEKGNFLNGNKNGNFIINFENGKKQFEQNWKNGSLESETEYDENGKNLTLLREEEARKVEKERLAAEKIKKQEEAEKYNKIQGTWICTENYATGLKDRKQKVKM